MAGPALFFYYGYLANKKLQEKVVNFSKNFWNDSKADTEFIDIVPSNEQCPVIKHFRHTGKNKLKYLIYRDYLMNFFGFIPIKKFLFKLCEDDESETEEVILTGQFIFNKQDNCLVTFKTLPDQINASNHHPKMAKKPSHKKWQLGSDNVLEVSAVS